MGLFSSKKTYVASTIYNMAGDIKDRPSYLKTLIASQAIIGRASSYTDAIKDGYLNGPGVRLKNYGAWGAEPGNFPTVGLIRGDYRGNTRITPEDIEELIPLAAGQSVNLQRTEIGTADYSYWSEQWMLENHPDLFDSTWKSDFDEATNTITVTFEDLTTAQFQPADFDPQGAYLYVLYNLVEGPKEGDIDQGNVIIGPFPSTAGWILVEENTTPTNVPLTETVDTTVSYSDGRPDETSNSSTNSSGSYDHYRATYTQENYHGDTKNYDDFGQPELVRLEDDVISSTGRTLYLFRDGYVDSSENTQVTTEEIDDGNGGTLTKTTTTVTTTETLRVEESYRYNETEKILWTFLPAQILIYRIGSGGSPTIDSKFSNSADSGYFLPFIPVRLDNEMVDENFSGNPDAYDEARRAYWKMTGSRKYTKELLTQIDEHENVDDMDFVYVMLGASLNTKENAARRYIFEFFEKIRVAQTSGASEYNEWFSGQEQFGTDNAAWIEWRLAQKDPGNPLYGQPMPTTGRSYAPPRNEVRIKGNGTLQTNLDMLIKWNSMTKSTGVGQVKPGAKIGDAFIDFVGRDEAFSIGYNNGVPISLDPVKMGRLLVSLQTGASTWALLSIVGLEHKNYIYNGKAVEITAEEAMDDTEESGFLVPIHLDVFRDMPMVAKTQMSTACCYVVINTYVVKKTGFFGSTFFKILLFVAVVAITVATGGTGASSIGLLGANAAVGAAIGLSGFIGVLVGALANALAAMVVIKIVQSGATALLGDKIGSIIGAVMSIAVLQVGTALQGGFSLAQVMGQMGSAVNILNMTVATSNGIAGYIRGEANETLKDIEDLQARFKKESERINELYEKEFGLYRAILDPLELVNREELAYEGAVEGLDAFLDRTLMTGIDVAELSNALVSDFADITLSTIIGPEG